MSDITTQPRAPQIPAAHRRPHGRMGRIIVALILREMATTYGKSAGGYLWAVIEPVLGIVILALIFGMMLNEPALGTSFPLFYASGFLPFTMFNSMAAKIALSIRFSRPFLAYPSVTFIDTMIARALLNMLTNIAVIAIVITGIFIVYQIPPVVNMAAIFESLVMISLLGIGVGSMNCYLMTAFPVWERTWQIVTRPLFLISGTLFLYDFMPSSVQNLLWYNPLLHCVGLMRRGIYPTYEAAYVNQAYVVGVSVVLLVFGLLLLKRFHRDLLER